MISGSVTPGIAEGMRQAHMVPLSGKDCSGTQQDFLQHSQTAGVPESLRERLWYRKQRELPATEGQTSGKHGDGLLEVLYFSEA